MKNKIFLLLMLLVLSSCAVTDTLWESDVGGDKIEYFFVNRESNRVVLLGDQHPVTKKGEHYSLSEPTDKLFKTFEIAERSNLKDVAVYFARLTGKGSKITGGWGWVSYKLDSSKISKEDEEYLRKNNRVNLRKNSEQEYVSYDIKVTSNLMTRYSSSKETFKNFCSDTNQDVNCSKVIKLKSAWQDSIVNSYTVPEKSWRVLLTPFTVVADIILIPFYALEIVRQSKM